MTGKRNYKIIRESLNNQRINRKKKNKSRKQYLLSLKNSHYLTQKGQKNLEDIDAVARQLRKA